VAYRRITEVEKPAAMAALGLGFGIPAEAREWTARIDADQLRVMEVDGEFASVLRLSRMPQYWLGRPVPSGQVLSLATSLEHGGRGYGLALLEGMLAELHEAGVPTVTLQPSTARFYRTAGFEFAGSWNIYEVNCEHVPPLDRAYRVRRLPGDELGPIMKLYEQVAPTRHGAFAREEWWWRVALTRPRPNEGKEAVNLLLETEDGPVGWAMLAFGAETGSANEPVALRVRIQDWGWLPGHDLAVLGVLAGYRTMEGMVRWSGPDPDPFLFLLPNESIRLVRRRYWMLRLVDVAAAFGARPYPPEAAGRVVLRLEDPRCPWNSGTWSLEIEGGQGRMERAGGGQGGAPRATTEAMSTIGGLAALFTGFSGPDELARAGLLDGPDPAGLEVLRAAFAGPKPYTAELY
jgi:predicted acetyltransferase